MRWIIIILPLQAEETSKDWVVSQAPVRKSTPIVFKEITQYKELLLRHKKLLCRQLSIKKEHWGGREKAPARRGAENHFSVSDQAMVSVSSEEDLKEELAPKPLGNAFIQLALMSLKVEKTLVHVQLLLNKLLLPQWRSSFAGVANKNRKSSHN